MRRYFDKAFGLARSSTARDTYILFFSNVATAFLGFVFTWFVARALSVSDFGVFSAVNNLALMIVPILDLGVSSALINFIASIKQGEDKKAKEYIKAGLVIRVLFFLFISFILFAFGRVISNRLLASDDISLVYWAIVILIGLSLSSFVSSVLQAYKRFSSSMLVEVSYSFGRVVFVLLFALAGLTLSKSLFAFALTGLVTVVVTYFVLGFDFLRAKPKKDIYLDLVKFSGWLGVNRILSSISGRADIQMLAALAGATVTGYYSVASRLAFFIAVLTSSFAAVISPRLASMGDKEKEKRFILKSVLALLGISLGIIFWVIIAKPFVLFLFGTKYLESFKVFQALALSMIPFLFTAPSVSAIIYAMKKPKIIGVFSVFQTAAILVLNYLLIPKFGAFGPTITFGITNTILLVYTWGIVIKYYTINSKS
ncbi:MAG: polysaccharide biosynthesis related protein [Candidatus Woesebacteria bacterium]|nr:MAG: polysaccharide biosynthesis related protein [Candidatus Woesebacteria bacterium]